MVLLRSSTATEGVVVTIKRPEPAMVVTSKPLRYQVTMGILLSRALPYCTLHIKLLSVSPPGI